MKFLKLCLLLTIGVYAEIKLDVSAKIDACLVEKIVHDGYSELEYTLKYVFISNVEMLIPEILGKIKKPVLDGIETKENPFPLPKILLTKDDYLLLISYCKYLEYMDKKDEALEIYINILEGLNNIENRSLLSLVFYMSIENLVIESLVNNLKGNVLEQIYMKEKIKPLLMLNKTRLRDTLEHEKIMSTKVVASSFNKKMLIFFDKIYYIYNKTLYEVKNKEELEVFKKEFNVSKMKIISSYINWFEKSIVPDINLTRDELVVAYIFMMDRHSFNIIEDVLKNIKRNKVFLNLLGRGQK